MTTAIWWVRRDLRLHDNDALRAALATCDTVVPVFVLDPALLAAPDVSSRRVAFMLGGLAALDADLRARGSRLIVRRGAPLDELARLVAETGAAGIYAEADPWPYGRRRDAAVAATLPLHLNPGVTVWPADAVVKADGTPYTVFTPYSRAWQALPPPVPAQLWSPPERLPALPDDLSGLPLPVEPEQPSADALFVPGEAEALRRLAAFAGGSDAAIGRYDAERNRMDLDGTSQLSPYLRFGMFSARRAAVAARSVIDGPAPGVRQGAETWYSELIWREFYMAILYHFPFVLDQAFREQYRAIPWRNNEAEFAAWCAGRTGFPVVDAGMRQLTATGWMHNRARMIVASFLVKDLLIDWRWGERFFMLHLLDGDPAANNGGWQWTAGVGTDAAPYFRIFNPALQGARFDPDGAYVRRWVPELASVPAKYIHEPGAMSPALQRELGVVIGRDYPAPIVDHALARERTLAAYGR